MSSVKAKKRKNLLVPTHQILVLDPLIPTSDKERNSPQIFTSDENNQKIKKGDF